MDKQIVFNTVVNHLRTQGQRASGRGGGGCFYRVDAGEGKILKCAVGCLIPDHLYLPMMEDCTVWALPETDNFETNTGKRGALLRAALALAIPDFNPDPKGEDVQFLTELQKIHDGAGPHGWEAEFTWLAQQHNLTIPPKISVDGKIEEYPGWD